VNAKSPHPKAEAHRPSSQTRTPDTSDGDGTQPSAHPPPGWAYGLARTEATLPTVREQPVRRTPLGKCAATARRERPMRNWPFPPIPSNRSSHPSEARGSTWGAATRVLRATRTTVSGVLPARRQVSHQRRATCAERAKWCGAVAPTLRGRLSESSVAVTCRCCRSVPGSDRSGP
jgi:hypothetical protein